MQPHRGCFLILSFSPHDFANATSWGFHCKTHSAFYLYCTISFECFDVGYKDKGDWEREPIAFIVYVCAM